MVRVNLSVPRVLYVPLCAGRTKIGANQCLGTSRLGRRCLTILSWLLSIGPASSPRWRGFAHRSLHAAIATKISMDKMPSPTASISMKFISYQTLIPTQCSHASGRPFIPAEPAHGKLNNANAQPSEDGMKTIDPTETTIRETALRLLARATHGLRFAELHQRVCNLLPDLSPPLVAHELRTLRLGLPRGVTFLSGLHSEPVSTAGPKAPVQPVAASPWNVRARFLQIEIH